ncbi:MAG: hypothetical protein U1F34_07700 [Gammaproteobacteria bacterium]
MTRYTGRQDTQDVDESQDKSIRNNRNIYLDIEDSKVSVNTAWRRLICSTTLGLSG